MAIGIKEKGKLSSTWTCCRYGGAAQQRGVHIHGTCGNEFCFYFWSHDLTDKINALQLCYEILDTFCSKACSEGHDRYNKIYSICFQ
jgi:hypothetical protein